jgi:hypothetical protein
MAIKGKARSRGGKGVSRGPKPVYVPVRVPILRRRGFWIGALIVLVVGSVAGIAYGLAREASSKRADELQARLATTMRTYQGNVDPILSKVGQTTPPAGFTALPSLGPTLDGLQKGKTSPKDAISAAKTAASQAKDAADALNAFDVPKLVGAKGFTVQFVNYAINAKTRFVEALSLYQRVAALIETATKATGPTSGEILTTAKGVLDTANQVFSEGYSDYVEAQTEAGTFAPTFASGGGLPGVSGAGVPGAGS